MSKRIANADNGANKDDTLINSGKTNVNIFHKFLSAAKLKIRYYKRLFRNNKKNSILFFTGTLMFSICVLLLSNIQVGYAVVFNNQTIGYVTEKNSAQLAIDSICEEMKDNGITDVTFSATFSPSIAPGMYFKDNHEISSIIKSSLEAYTDACIISANGNPVVTVKDKDTALKLIDSFKDSRIGNGGEVLSKEISETVEYIDTRVIHTSIRDYDTALSIIDGTASKEGFYTVEEGDTLWNIAIDNNIATDHLMELNNLDTDLINIGDVLRVVPPKPQLTVVVTKRIEYTEYLPYETEYVYDKSLTKGTKRTVQAGQNGENYVTAVVTLTDLHETDRVIESSEHICDPIKEIIHVGTKEKPKTAATGRFGRPINGGYVSSAFGNRSRGYHTGIDYALSYGSPIYASDGGTVTFSGWSGGYGYMIKINHGNGYETLYAHCSKLVVSSGKKVAKGQVIAYVGSTGNSTGPHLHFEIRKNGSYMNPANYF